MQVAWTAIVGEVAAIDGGINEVNGKRSKNLRRKSEAWTLGHPYVLYQATDRVSHHGASATTIINLAPECTRAVYQVMKRGG